MSSKEQPGPPPESTDAAASPRGAPGPGRHEPSERLSDPSLEALAGGPAGLTVDSRVDLAADASADVFSDTGSESALIVRAQGGDFEAFEQLITRYQEKVYRLAFRFMRNETEAKEIVQDTLLSVWRKLGTFKGDSQFGSWLFRVTANAALMRLRSQRRHAEVSTEELPAGFLDSQHASYGQMLSHGENWSRRPDEELQSEELRRQIQKAVDDLPEIYRTVFLVRDVDGLSTEETAEALDLSIPTVKTRLHRARIALRDAIGAHFDGPTAHRDH